MSEVFLISNGNEEPGQDDINIYVSELESPSQLSNGYNVTKIRSSNDIGRLNSLDDEEVGVIVYPNLDGISNGVSFRPNINTLVEKIGPDQTYDAERLSLGELENTNQIRSMVLNRCRSKFARL